MPQSLPQSSHKSRGLTRKKGLYYYRRRLPGKRGQEVVVSLRTRDFREAEHLGELLDAEFDRRRDTMTEAVDLQRILRGYLQDCLAVDWEIRSNAKPGRPVYTTPLKVDPQTDPIDIDYDDVSGWLSSAREALARREVSTVNERVTELMAEYGVPEEYRKALGMGILAANVELHERMLARVTGHGWEDLPPALASSQTSVDDSGVSFSEFAKSYVEFATTEHGWTGQTKLQSEKTFSMFLEWSGDKPLKGYARRDTGAFFEMLRKLPAMYGKDKQWRGLTLKEIIEASKEADVARLSMKTVKRHFSALGGLFSQAVRVGQYDAANPAHGFDFPMKGRANAGRLMWEGDQLRKLFASPIWTGCHPHFRSRAGAEIIRDDKFWLPLLGLYHGNRLEEFAQLRRVDVQQQEGIWLFKISDEGERQLKNAQANRRVPVHPYLIERGFLDYVAGLPDDPEGMVFPELKPGGPDNKFGFYFSKWFTAYRRSIGLYQNKLDYHSFRHGVTTKLFSGGVGSTVVDELTGHESKGTSASTYNKGATLKDLKDAISKVEWPEVEL